MLVSCSRSEHNLMWLREFPALSSFGSIPSFRHNTLQSCICKIFAKVEYFQLGLVYSTISASRFRLSVSMSSIRLVSDMSSFISTSHHFSGSQLCSELSTRKYLLLLKSYFDEWQENLPGSWPQVALVSYWTGLPRQRYSWRAHVHLFTIFSALAQSKPRTVRLCRTLSTEVIWTHTCYQTPEGVQLLTVLRVHSECSQRILIAHCCTSHAVCSLFSHR